MRIVIAPDKFAGTLTAVEAAAAIRDGWHASAPADELVTVPMADGGPGFLDVLSAALGGQLISATVNGPTGAPVPAAVLLHEHTAYIESAQACGLDLVPTEDRRPGSASSYGVGQLVAAAIDAGARRIVIGLGGSGTTDGGAGLLAALGAVAEPADALTGGPLALERLESVDIGPARSRVGAVELVAATDVDNPLLGLRGATNIFGPQKGVADHDLPRYDAALQRLADRSGAGKVTAAGAGAAGGIGWALLVLGGTRVAGVGTVAEALGLAEQVGAADIVVSGEGSFDSQSAGGKVVMGVARFAEAGVRPCVVIAGQVLVGARQMRAMGIDGAYGVVDVVGRDASFARPAESLAATAARVAKTWSRR